MKKILLFGAGKSASVLIAYLLGLSKSKSWHITVADANRQLILEKTNNHDNSTAVELDINDAEKRYGLISESDIVISMMPPSLHVLIARDCIRSCKSLLTASYADDEIKSFDREVKEKGILFLCEMGLDPGIDHMSAMQLLDGIRANGGVVNSFKSHCGGLVAPESDDNPWHYKITWNPRNIVLAGKAGAIYKQGGKTVSEPYESLFDSGRTVLTGNSEVPELSYYPNRNSLPYIDLYGLQDAETFIRTTLRYRDFMTGWQNIIRLKLSDETPVYDSNGKSLGTLFTEHFTRNGFSELLLTGNSSSKLVQQQLDYLGIHDSETIVNKGLCSAADILQFALEKKLALGKYDKDMIVMLHEIGYTSADGRKNQVNSSLLVKGDDQVHTAMAKTVGLPLGIAAKMILDGNTSLTGVHIPVMRDIYEPVMDELKLQGVSFHESHVSL